MGTIRSIGYFVALRDEGNCREVLRQTSLRHRLTVLLRSRSRLLQTLEACFW